MSFGHDVRDNAAKKGAQASPWTGIDGVLSPTRPRSRLTEALENSRRKGRTKAVDSREEAALEANDDEDLWEEVDEPDRDPDVTIDLNEPYSRSGKYWKSEFQRYQDEAKVEMAKLVKYKHLAKSYAQMKDAESMDLNEKLKEEQEKVGRMESRISDLAGQIARKRMKGTDRDNQEMISKLTRETALAVQYRNQVKELEAILKERQQQPDDNSRPQRQTASPRTHKTLLETQRELRRAREQLKELADAKDEVRRLKSALRSAEQKQLKVEAENKKLSSKVEAAEEESRRKEEGLEALKREHDTLKTNAKARVGEAEQVLRRKNEQISELRKKATKTEREGHHNNTDAPGVDSGSSWNRELAELQAKLQIEQTRRRSEPVVPREKLEEVAKAANPNLPMGGDLDPGSQKANILEDDSISSPFVIKENPPEARHHRSSSRLQGYDKYSSQVVLTDRTSRDNNVTAKRRKPSPHRGSRELRLEEATHDTARGPQPPARSSSAAGGRLASKASDSRRPSSADSDVPGIDLVHGKFARLGGPEVSNSSAVWAVNASKSTLPPDRRAAAIARLEQKRAQRKRGLGDFTYDKENVRP